MDESIRVLLIPSSDYLGHPFPQRYNHIFERLHGKNLEIHVLRFRLSDEVKIPTHVMVHELEFEVPCKNATKYYALNSVSHNIEVLRLIRNEGIDIVVVSNLSPALILPLLKLFRAINIPIIFDLQDYYPSGAAGYVSSQGSILYSIAEEVALQITKTLIRYSDIVTAPSRTLLRLAKRLGAKRAFFIPNGIPEYFTKLYKDQALQLRKEFGLYDSIILGFVGSIEFWLRMDTVVEALYKLVDKGLDVKFVIIGGGLQTSYAVKLWNQIKELDLKSHVVKLGFIPHRLLPSYVAMFDIGLIPFDENSRLTLFVEEPLKLLEYLSQEVIVFATPLKGLLLHTRQYCAFYRNAEELAKLIMEFIDRREYYITRAKMGRQFVIQNRTWNKIAKLFHKCILEALAIRRKRGIIST